MRNGQIVLMTDLVSFGGHYEMTFNALHNRLGHYGVLMTGHMVQILIADWTIQSKQ